MDLIPQKDDSKENLAIGMTIAAILLFLSRGLVRLLGMELGYEMGEGTILGGIERTLGWAQLTVLPAFCLGAIYLNKSLKIKNLTGANILTMVLTAIGRLGWYFFSK